MKITTLALLTVLVAAGIGCGGSSYNRRPEPGVPDPSTGRSVTINGRAPKAKEWATLAQLEKERKTKLPDGHYFYDKKSGLFGKWGGPAVVVIPAGLKIGPSMKAESSGRGTGVYVNGRDIHPAEKVLYEKMLGQRIPPGRYWLDDKGNCGVEGPSVLEILVLAAAASAYSGGNGGGGGWMSGGSYANAFSSGEYGGANGAWSHSADYGGGRVTVAGDNSGGGVVVDGKCVTWGW